MTFLPKKPFKSTQQAVGSNIAQATNGATATVINVNVDQGAQPKSLDQIVRILEAASGANRLPSPNIEDESSLIVTGPPEKPNLRINRQRLTSSVQRALSASRPILLLGESGSGRSELARGATEGVARLVWLDFNANQNLRATSVLDSALRGQIGIRQQEASAEFTKLLRELPAGLVLVLDNVDAALIDPGFATRLAQLAKNSAESQVVLICSSIHPLPSALQSLFEEIAVPRYDDTDLRGTLEAYGAPLTVNRNGFRGVIMGLTQGQPELTNLLVQFLAQNGWLLSDDVWLGLIEQTFASNLKDETQRRLLSTEDTDTLDLLYRLISLMRPFTEKEALQIARIEPEIPQAMQRVTSLYGRWLQRAGDKSWRTSPLLSGLGDGNLVKRVKSDVHKTVVQWILSRKKLNQLETSEAISHLVLAEDFDQAGSLLFRALYSLLNAGPDVEPGNLLSLWKDLPLPPEMSLGLRIGIRGMQAAIAIQRGLDYSSQLADLRELMTAPYEDFAFMTSFASLSAVALQLVSKKPIEALPFISQAAERQGQITDPRIVETFEGHSSSEMFWSVAMKIETREGVRQWIREVDALASEQRDALMRASFAPESACRMFDAVWTREQELPEDKRDWTGLMAFIAELEAVALRWNSSLIAGGLLRVKQAIRIFHLREVDEAIKEAERFVSTHDCPEAAVGRFLVSHGTGLWLTDINRWDDAMRWLARASEYQERHLALHRQQNYLRYGIALYRAGTPEIAPFHEAVRLADEEDSLTPLNQIRARAELSTFLWLTGKEDDLFEEWSKVVQQTLDVRDGTSRWKQIYVLVSNHTAYWGNRIGQMSGSSEGMVIVPELGMFITDYADASNLYSDKILFIMPGNMSWFAERIGKFKEAAMWASVTVQTAEQFSQSSAGKGFLLQTVPYALETGSYREALEAAADAVRGITAQEPIEFPEAVLRDNPRLSRGRATTIDAVKCETDGIVIGLLPGVIAIVAEGFKDRAGVSLRLDELLDVCASQRELSSAPAAWDAARQVLQSMRDGSLRYSDFADEERESGDWIGLMVALLRSFALLGMKNDQPVDILRAQIKWAAWLTASFALFPGVGTMVAPLLAKAWSGYIQQNGFFFRGPSNLIRVIQETGNRGQLGRLLVEVADGLGAGLSQTFRERLIETTFKVVRYRA